MDLLSLLASNHILTGLAGGSVVMSVLYMLRDLPKKIGKWLAWRFTCAVVVFSEDSAFDMLSDWLAAHESLRNTRRLRLDARHSDREARERLTLTPGFGVHLFWHRGRPVFVKRELDEKDGLGHRRRETINMWTVGRSPELLRGLVDSIAKASRGEDVVEVYVWTGYWAFCSRRPKRALETVVMDADQRGEIVEDLERFVDPETRRWYATRGIPYRRGIMLHGPPGCGKTSLATALASHLDRRIYVLNIGSLHGDDALIEAVSRVPEDAVLLVEDLDAAQHDRSAERSDSDEHRPRIVTMSCLLNCVDGMLSRDGRILIMTTNRIDRLDPALLRPGRSDRIEFMGEVGPREVAAMARLFLRDEDEVERFVSSFPMPARPADVQRALIETRGPERRAEPAA